MTVNRGDQRKLIDDICQALNGSVIASTLWAVAEDSIINHFERALFQLKYSIIRDEDADNLIKQRRDANNEAIELRKDLNVYRDLIHKITDVVWQECGVPDDIPFTDLPVMIEERFNSLRGGGAPKRSEEAYRLLMATKKARRHMNKGMQILMERTTAALLQEGVTPNQLIGQGTRPIAVGSDFLVGARQALKAWFDIYEEANKIWQKEAGVGRHAYEVEEKD